jgi:hypothetical protein
MVKAHVKYDTGQWFAVPLRDGGYALGIIVRGSYRTKGGLGYFFGPKHEELPNSDDISALQPSDAVLITWFGDLGIIRGKWPLIFSNRAFRSEEWPIPLFRRDATSEKGWLVEYHHNATGYDGIMRETLHEMKDLEGLPREADFGSGAIEIELTKVLAASEASESKNLID